MHVGQAPFTDVRVRQAFRLLVNRPQMVRQVLADLGRVGNDITSTFDQCYAGDEFPQRRYDPERAKSLLKAAGQEGLTIDLEVGPTGTASIETATAFAQTAKAAGITVNVKVLDLGTLYGAQFLDRVFYVDTYSGRSYLAQVVLSHLTTSTYNVTHWNIPRFNALYRQALATRDSGKRCELIKEMQRIEYDQGGFIIPYFLNQVDAYSTKVGGLKVNVDTLSLNEFGNRFRELYFV